MKESANYIVIESRAKAILRAKKKLRLRNYTIILDDDFVEADKLAFYCFKELNKKR